MTLDFFGFCAPVLTQTAAPRVRSKVGTPGRMPCAVAVVPPKFCLPRAKTSRCPNCDCPRVQEPKRSDQIIPFALMPFFARPKASKINKDRQIASGYKKEVAELNCPDSNSLSVPSGAVSSTARRPQGAKYISMLDGRTFDKVQDKVIQSPSGKIRTKSVQHHPTRVRLKK